MDLIDRSALEAFCATCKTQDYSDGVIYVLEYIDSLPTVDAIPIEFIKKRIDILHSLSEYEFEANGGYCGQASTSEYELKNLLKDWEKEQEKHNET